MNKKMKKIPHTTHRVPLNSCPIQNNLIRNQTICKLNKAKNSSKAAISRQIKQLNKEWDTERVVEVQSASLILLSSLMGIRNGRMWFGVTALIGVFLLNHGLYGWCPSLPIIRKMGIRTAEEINIEKTVLKMIRGDFSNIGTDVVALYNMAVKQ
ncbi:MAG: DUF2892 domain-containing protein [Lachnoclostridium sp.]